MAATPIGVGLVGYGMSGRVLHVPLLTASRRFELRAIADPRLAGAASPVPSVPVVPDLRSILKDPRVELVVVATPNATHLRLVERALQAGRHVVVEKPFTPTVRAADRLIDLARKTGRVLSVFHCRRWDDDFRTVAEAIEAKQLGAVQRYVARFEFFARPGPDDWRRRPGPGSGLLYDVGSHLVDQALTLFGMPVRVSAQIRATDGGPDWSFVVVLDHGAVESVLLGSERAQMPGPTFDVQGNRGSLVLVGRDGQEQRLAAGLGSGRPFGRRRTARLTLLEGDRLVSRGIPRARSSYLSFYDGLARSIREGGPPPVTPEDARSVIAVIEAARRSARSGRTVRIGGGDQPA